MSSENQKNRTFTELLAELPLTEKAQVEHTLHQYLAVVKRLYEYILEHDLKTLTELRRRAKLTRKGQKPHN